jgi:hypothetical protein
MVMLFSRRCSSAEEIDYLPLSHENDLVLFQSLASAMHP